MPEDILELEPGQLVLIGIGLALITIILVGLGYSAARIMTPGPSSARREVEDTDEEAGPDPGSIQAMERELRRTEEIRHIASRVSHDFNNIVFAASGRVQILKQKVSDEQVRTSLDEIEAALDPSMGIFGSLTRINQRHTYERANLPIEPEVQALISVVRTLLPRSIHLSFESHVPEETLVRIDQITLQQVLTGILANAVEAIGDDSGRVEVELAPGGDQDPEVVLLTIDDDGPGIKAEDRTAALTSFHSTRPSSPEAGLGLPIAKRLLGAQGAGISLGDSRLGGLRVELRMLAASDAT